MSAASLLANLRFFRAATATSLLCFAMICVAQSAQISSSPSRQEPPVKKQQDTTGTAPRSPGTEHASSAIAPLTPITSVELIAELSEAKDRPVIIANKYITGAVTVDAEQGAMAPMTYRVEFRNCEFADDVVVNRVEFGRSLLLLRVKFDKGLVLRNLSIKGDLDLQNVQARYQIINRLQVDGEVRITNPVITEKETTATGKEPAPKGLQVEYLRANNLTIAAITNSIPEIDLEHLTTGRFNLSGRPGANGKVDRLDLDNSTLRDAMFVQNLELQTFDAVNLSVGKRIWLRPVTTIRKSLNLRSANLGGLEWRIAGAVQFPEKVDISSATLGKINVIRVPPPGSELSDTSLRELRADRTDYGLGLLERANYYVPAYASYEAAYKSLGQSDKANAVYFAMRDRLRYTEFHDAYTPSQKFITGFNYVIGFLHKWLFGYGRSWVYPLVWCLIFLILDAYVFRDIERMQKVDEKSSEAFDPIWYSLDIFVPVLNLGVADKWRPKEEFRLLRFYARLLSLIGLIFASAVVGALTGTLK